MASNTLTQPLTPVGALAQGKAQVATARRRFDPFSVFAYVLLTFMAIIFVAPLVWMTAKSVMTFGEANSTALIPTSIHLENYTQVLTDDNFAHYLVNTIALEILTVVGQTIVSLLAAYGFARIRFPGRDLLFGLFLITIFVPVTVKLVPELIIVTKISQAFASINPSLAWIDNWPAQVIPFLASTFSIFLLRQFFMQVPEDLWDAARIDGAGHLRYLFAILVPVSRAAVITVILFTFIGTWSAFEWPLLVTNSDNWRPIAVALYNFSSGENAVQTQLLMAGSMLAILPIMLIYFLAQKTFIEGITTTGLKG
ncbi:MAG: carbohydrate ABC transporter permease [Aggregatilineales bacterium]